MSLNNSYIVVSGNRVKSYQNVIKRGVTGLAAFSLDHSGFYQRVFVLRAAIKLYIVATSPHYSTFLSRFIARSKSKSRQCGGQQLLFEMHHSFTISVLTKLQKLWSRLSKMTKVFCVLIVGLIALLAFASAGGDDAAKKGPKVTDKVG